MLGLLFWLRSKLDRLKPAPIWRSLKRSILPAKTAFVDGDIAAMWGLGGTLLGDTGVPWILTAPAIEKVPLALVRESRKDIAEWLGFKRRLENLCAADYRAAIRFRLPRRSGRRCLRQKPHAKMLATPRQPSRVALRGALVHATLHGGATARPALDFPPFIKRIFGSRSWGRTACRF